MRRTTERDRQIFLPAAIRLRNSSQSIDRSLHSLNSLINIKENTRSPLYLLQCNTICSSSHYLYCKYFFLHQFNIGEKHTQQSISVSIHHAVFFMNSLYRQLRNDTVNWGEHTVCVLYSTTMEWEIIEVKEVTWCGLASNLKYYIYKVIHTDLLLVAHNRRLVVFGIEDGVLFL